MGQDTILMMVLGFATTLICIMTPIIKLNTSITKLNITLDELKEQTKQNHQELKERIRVHGDQIDNLLERVIKLENRM